MRIQDKQETRAKARDTCKETCGSMVCECDSVRLFHELSQHDHYNERTLRSYRCF